MAHESLVIILAVGGSPPDLTALGELSGTTVCWQRVEREGRAACLAARVRHGESPGEFGTRIRGWGRARGWTVTVAPCGSFG